MSDHEVNQTVERVGEQLQNLQQLPSGKKLAIQYLAGCNRFARQEKH